MSAEIEQAHFSSSNGAHADALLASSEAAGRAIVDRARAEAAELLREARAESERARREADELKRRAEEMMRRAGEVLRDAEGRQAGPPDGELRRLDSAVVELSVLADQLRVGVERVAVGLAELSGESARGPAARGDATEDHRRALLIALNMATNGASRTETARYLAEHLELSNPAPVLDSVYRHFTPDGQPLG